jgi:hypothetical protein
VSLSDDIKTLASHDFGPMLRTVEIVDDEPDAVKGLRIVVHNFNGPDDTDTGMTLGAACEIYDYINVLKKRCADINTPAVVEPESHALIRKEARENCGTWGVETIDKLLDHINTLTAAREGSV